MLSTVTEFEQLFSLRSRECHFDASVFGAPYGCSRDKYVIEERELGRKSDVVVRLNASGNPPYPVEACTGVFRVNMFLLNPPTIADGTNDCAFAKYFAKSIGELMVLFGEAAKERYSVFFFGDGLFSGKKVFRELYKEGIDPYWMDFDAVMQTVEEEKKAQ